MQDPMSWVSTTSSTRVTATLSVALILTVDVLEMVARLAGLVILTVGATVSGDVVGARATGAFEYADGPAMPTARIRYWFCCT